MSAADMFWAAPPVSRTITAATLIVSIATHLGFIPAYYVVLLPYKILTLRSVPELWRLVSCFLLTGPQLQILMDPYFLYLYASKIEIETLPAPGDFFIYTVFVSAVITAVGGFYLNGMALLSALTVAFARTYSLQNPNRQMSFFIVTFASKWLPFVMLAMTLVQVGPTATLIQSTGLLAAHAYDFFARIWPEQGGGRRWLETPAIVKQWFAPPPGTAQGRAYGTAIPANPRNVGSAPPSTGGGWTSGSSWTNRGTGRRLG